MNKKTIFAVIALIGCLNSSQLGALGGESPAEAGTLDLSSADFGDACVPLNGEWRFIWGKFALPDDSEWENAKTLAVPGVWTGKRLGDAVLPLTGFGTYRLDVILPPDVPRLGLRLGPIGTAYTLYVDDEIVLHSGRIGIDREACRANYQPQDAYFAHSGGRARLTLQVANFHDRMSGIWTEILIGDAERIFQRSYIDNGMDMLLIGVFCIIGVYYLISWYLGGRGGAYLWFGLCCLALGLRTMSAGQVFLMRAFPWFDFEWNYKVQFISQAATVFFFFASLRHLFPDEIKGGLLRFIAWSMLAYALSILATPLMIHSLILRYFHIFLLLMMVVTLALIALAAFKRRSGACTIEAGLALFCFTVLNDILYSNAFIQTGYLVPYGLIVFSISYIVVLTRCASDRLASAGILLGEPASAFLRKEGISNREYEVLAHLLKGKDYDAIGEDLFISKSTVTKHIHSIYRKLKVRNRVNLYDYVSRINKMV